MRYQCWGQSWFRRYVDHTANDTLAMGSTFKVKEVVSNKRSVFIGHGYVQHAEAGLKGIMHLGMSGT